MIYSNTVVQLNSKTKQRYSSKARKYSISDDVMNTLRLKMYDYDIKDIAEEIEVTIQCAYNVRNGKTKWPRPKTFFALLEFLGVEMHLYEVSSGRYL